MENSNMSHGIKLSYAHFPVGTTFKIKGLKGRHKEKVFTTAKVMRNGVDSYAVQTTTPIEYFNDPNMVSCFHLSHVCEIVKRGEGPVIVEDSFKLYDAEKPLPLRPFTTVPRAYRLWSKAPSQRSNYVFFPRLPVHLIIDQMPQVQDVALNDVALSKALKAQSFLKHHVVEDPDYPLRFNEFYTAPKKRFNRWIKQNINRFLVNKKKAHLKALKEMYDEMDERSDDDFMYS